MSEWRPSSKPTGALLRLFVKIDVTNLHARTLTSHAVLVNRIPRARWLFSQMALLDLRTSPPSGIGRHAGGWDVGCHTPEGFGGRRVRRSPKSSGQHGQCGPVACLRTDDRLVTWPLLAHSALPQAAPRAPSSPAPMPRILGRVARAMRPHMGDAWSTCSSRRTVEGCGATAQSALGWYRPSVGVPETLDG